jgi:GNAT superfamily N-acetyltransferase
MWLGTGMPASVMIVRLGQSGAAQGQKPSDGGRNQQSGHGISDAGTAITHNHSPGSICRRRCLWSARIWFGIFMPDLSIRPARPQDAGLILTLLTELAAFEKLTITLTQEEIAFDFFGLSPRIECEIAFEGDTAVGLTTYYWTYATFRAARRLYVEDLFIRPGFRGRGYGKSLLQYLARKGLAAGAARLEWQVLDWNAPAIAFYRGIGAHPHEGWYTYWLEGNAMKTLGET